MNPLAFVIRGPLFVFFTFVTFVGDQHYNLATVLLVAILAWVAEVLLLYGIRPLLSLAPLKGSIWAIWAMYWLAGELSGVALLCGLQVPFIAPGIGVTAWVILVFNGFLAVVWLTASNLAVVLLAKDLQLLRELTSQTATLVSLNADAYGRLQSEFSELKETISEKVLTILLQINEQLKGLSSNSTEVELLRQASLVQEICESEVRQLSHEIADKATGPKVLDVSIPRILNPWGASKAKPSDIELRLAWVAAVGVFNALAIALQRGGWLTASLSLLVIIAGIYSIQILDRLRQRYLKLATAVATAFAIICEYLVMSILAMLALGLVGTYVEEVAKFVAALYVTVPSVLIIIWVLVQVIQDSARRLRDYGADLAVQKELLERGLADLHSQSSRARRSLSQLLHGSTQGRLASVSMALTVAATAQSPQQLDDLLVQARRQLEASAEEIKLAVQPTESEKRVDIDREFEQLEAGWKNLVTLKFEISGPARRYLELNPSMVGIVADATKEFVTNAVRHGHARNIEAKLAIYDELTLQVSNDGLPIEKLTPGFGISSISGAASKIEIQNRTGWSDVALQWTLTHPAQSSLERL